MRRKQATDTNSAGHDSFLDIVTNMVGILIILVLIVGLRIKNAPAPLASPEAALRAAEALDRDQAAEQALRRQIDATVEQVSALEKELLLRGQQREALALLVAVAKRKIGERREQLDAGSQAEFDLRRELDEARASLERLRLERTRLDETPGETVLLENCPTPVSKIVLGEEIHFQLRGNRVTLAPLEKLVLAARDDARSKADKLLDRRSLPEFTETIGPIDGFRFRYTARRVDEVEETPQGTVRRVGLQFVQWTLIPVDSQLGEPLQDALADGSHFRRTLAGLRKDSTATLWVYEDSFEAFRAVRKELYRQGIAVATRPVPTGILIAGSPSGSKSEAQ